TARAADVDPHPIANRERDICVVALEAHDRRRRKRAELQRHQVHHLARRMIAVIEDGPVVTLQQRPLACRRRVRFRRCTRFVSHTCTLRAGPYATSARETPLVHRMRRSEEHTSELQSRENLVCRLLLEKKKQKARARSCSPSTAASAAWYGERPVLHSFPTRRSSDLGPVVTLQQRPLACRRRVRFRRCTRFVSHTCTLRAGPYATSARETPLVHRMR